VGLGSVLIASVAYVSALLWIARHFRGGLKIAISLFVYVLMSVVLFLSLLNILGVSPDPAMRQNWGYLVTVLITWVVMVAPGVIYIVHFKLSQLQRAGFFLPRGRLR
jgi:Na+/melibiose symporter-like transporter